MADLSPKIIEVVSGAISVARLYLQSLHLICGCGLSVDVRILKPFVGK